MPWITQMVGFAVMLLAMGIALWVSIWLLAILFAIGVAVVIWAHAKDYLMRKGILNPTPGVPFEQPADSPKVTVVEGDFERVDNIRE